MPRWHTLVGGDVKRYVTLVGVALEYYRVEVYISGLPD
jgi:hypothetical protein